MTSLRRRALTLLATTVLVGAATGCALTGSSAVVVEPSVERVTLEVGQTLVVDFGTINESVGDGWALVVEPDPAVLTVGEVESDYQGEDGEVGAPSTLTHSFKAVAPGETTIELQFSYRGSTDDADTLSRVDVPHSRILVTVE